MKTIIIDERDRIIRLTTIASIHCNDFCIDVRGPVIIETAEHSLSADEFTICTTEDAHVSVS